MIIKASGRSALIMTAGLLVLLASPVLAATDGDDSADSKSATAAPVTHRAVRHVSHHRQSYAHQKSQAVATKTDDDKKAATADATPDDNKALPDIPPSIANARAQMLLAGAQINAAAAIPPGTNVAPAAPDSSANASADNGTFMVAADQLNDVDRTLQEGSSTAAPTTTASSPPPAPATTMTGESSVWDETSLIGKIFIGFGALLTMASAARMFIG
jgi:hypothetical protein